MRAIDATTGLQGWTLFFYLLNFSNICLQKFTQYLQNLTLTRDLQGFLRYDGLVKVLQKEDLSG